MLPLNIAADTSRISLYIRVARAMSERINRGEWKVGVAIPTIEELCEQFDVSRNTMRQALEMLSNSGLIAASRGRPTMVKAARPAHLDDPRLFHAAINDPSATIDIRLLSKKTVKSLPPLIADRYALFDSYVWYRKVQSLGRGPYVLADFYVASSVNQGFSRGAERTTKFDLLLKQQTVMPIAEKRQLITTAHADEIEAKLMDCELGAMIVDVRRWWQDATGHLICGSISKYRAETFVFEVVDRQ